VADATEGERLRGDGLAHPERRMLLALLEDAIDQLLMLGLAEAGGPRSESERWLLSNDRTAPFSFVNVCETLNLDPRWLREKVIAEIAVRHGKKRGSPKRAAGGDAS
jgi:hypothetical protein